MVPDDGTGSAGRRTDGDGVETVLIGGAAESCDPGPRRDLEVLTFGGRDGGEGVFERGGGAGLDLDEGDCLATPDHEIELAVPRPPVPVQNLPAIAHERGSSDGFRLAS